MAPPNSLWGLDVETEVEASDPTELDVRGDTGYPMLRRLEIAYTERFSVRRETVRPEPFVEMRTFCGNH